MISPLLPLSRESKKALAAALRSGRLSPPYSPARVQSYVGAVAATRVASELGRLTATGMDSPQLAAVVELLAQATIKPPAATLVWTGPEQVGSESRDTGVVVRELFQLAETDVLIAGFAVYQGKDVFKTLAERMVATPSLRVRMFLNVERSEATGSEPEVLQAFASRFRNQQWPGSRLPEVYYDPRTLAATVRGQKRSALHAKCIAVDRRWAFVTSANFTEAAQQRNIEAGVLLDDPSFTDALIKQFELLIGAGALKRVPGL